MSTEIQQGARPGGSVTVRIQMPAWLALLLGALAMLLPAAFALIALGVP
jgi:hypothetical protein